MQGVQEARQIDHEEIISLLLTTVWKVLLQDGVTRPGKEKVSLANFRYAFVPWVKRGIHACADMQHVSDAVVRRYYVLQELQQ